MNPVQISKENNEWNKRALKIAKKHLYKVVTVDESGLSQNPPKLIENDMDLNKAELIHEYNKALAIISSIDKLHKNISYLKCALYNAKHCLIDGMARLDAWGPAPADRFWIEEARNTIRSISEVLDGGPRERAETSVNPRSNAESVAGNSPAPRQPKTPPTD